MATSLIAPPPLGFEEDFLKKLAEQHTTAQQLWLSGYLYGLAVNGGFASAAPSDTLESASFAAPVQDTPALKVTVLYGSQTGNSKKVGQLAVERLRAIAPQVTLADLNDYPVKNLKSEQIILLVVSTQGEGDPPTAAEDFYKWLLGPRAPRLEGLKFAVCGLGDRSYLHFCKTGQDFDARLEALGATRLADRADCDVEYEDTAEAWIEQVIARFPANPVAASKPSVRSNGHATAIETSISAARFDRKHPFQAPLLEKIQLNGRGSAKETWHLELSLEGSGLQYEPGDSLGVLASNPESLVREVLYAAMLNGGQVLSFQGQSKSFREILRHDVELSVLTRDLIEKYAQWTNSAPLKSILADPEALRKFLWGRNVADLLREYPAAMSEATLLGFLRKMPARLYSIASSLAAHPDEVHLTVAAVRYDFNGRPHQGVASTFLADQIAIGQPVSVFVERNEYFKLPKDDTTDIIMVGPGTGVAPFRSFVAERTERGASGKNWLFFGNPHFETDFLYHTEWLNHLKKGTLDRLDVAFSRDQANKVYVQHRLTERSKLIFERLENGAHFYVCGDKNHMAADVQHAVLQIVAKESGKGEDFAVEYLKDLKKQRRFLEDVY